VTARGLLSVLRQFIIIPPRSRRRGHVSAPTKRSDYAPLHITPGVVLVVVELHKSSQGGRGGLETYQQNSHSEQVVHERCEVMVDEIFGPVVSEVVMADGGKLRHTCARTSATNPAPIPCPYQASKQAFSDTRAVGSGS